MQTTLNLILGITLLLSLFYNYSVLGLLKKVEEKRRRDWDFARQNEKELLDRLMYATGKTWVLPPKENLKEGEELIDEELQKQLEGWREV